MKLSPNAITVLEKRYFKKDENGIMEDWEALLNRVASNISGENIVEDYDPAKKQKYFDLMHSGAFLPNSPTLMNAGNDLQQLSACFVLPIEDSMESIFTSIKNAALIHKSGGGTGFSFSKLREANSKVKTTNGVSSGPLSFLKVFNSATDAVKQGGTRRGANMAILSVDHPQILEFITCKENTTELTNFNLSVALTEEFMQAVSQDTEYELISPHTKEVVNRLKAQDVFALMVEMAHKNGEPGIVFIDRINRYNPTPHIGMIESTNPCGEQPLLANEACNLGSINLNAVVEDKKINWDKLKSVIYDSVEFLDNVIDRSAFPLDEIDKMVKANRKIGLGYMGWADVLFRLGIPYDSDEAVKLAEEVMEFLDYHGKVKSMELAKEKGSFPNFVGSIYEKGELLREKGKINWNSLAKDIKKNGLRNATVSTIAPTGTISMILNASSGVEPQFSLVYIKQVLDGEKLYYINPYFEEELKNRGLYSTELMEKIAESGSLHDLDLPEDLKRVYVTSHDISPEWHIKMQAAFQKYTDNAVSKTINFSRDATKDDIRIAFESAWKLGCKGVTVYRDGSRENQVLHVGSKTNEEKKDGETRVSPRNRPEITRGITQRVETGCGHLYVTINSDDNGPCEVFTQMGKVGGCASAQLEAIARLASLSLRANVKLESIIRQLKSIRCLSPMWSKGRLITSCADAIAYSLETYLHVDNTEQLTESVKMPDNPSTIISSGKIKSICPDCGSAIEFAEGCMKCNSCGWSKC
ncbi:MAG TPA: vitamin B12-dependent ribonucleotide reductase [Candidatus Cloacimonadota bacterium]|nr:vitamin B12-dependent ribonucleotide reductase [Candidatus Cloacimonadota bacterium]HOQ79841.1 vitamin B12-dependent ribonucleotide reductase [Candidatus Cloacimonadota bacterium]HPK40246.1 vitamin B12-dependent ribonucleotide reductase [Candidatus Cloacimonadota bacterium]